MATEIRMVEGDTAPDRTFPITRDGEAVNLAGVDKVELILLDTGSQTITNTGHQECTISDTPENGIVTYEFQSGDIASPNIHFGDITVTYGSGQVETDFDRLLIRVRPKVSTVS